MPKSPTFTNKVNMPIYNSLLAKRFILASPEFEIAPVKTDDLDATSFYHRRDLDRRQRRADKAFVKAVDAFMAKYPRGRGTAGNLELRRAYAACFTIKFKLSQRKSYGHRDDVVRRFLALGKSDKYLSYLVQLPSDGDMLEGKIDTQIAYRLIEAGLVSGLVDGRGSIVKQCLTDDGILISDWVRTHHEGTTLRAKPVASIETDDDEMNRAAMREIANFRTSDPKAFVANARAVLEKFKA